MVVWLLFCIFKAFWWGLVGVSEAFYSTAKNGCKLEVRAWEGAVWD